MRERSALLLLFALAGVLALLLHQTHQLEPIENLTLRLLSPLSRPLSHLEYEFHDFLRTLREVKVLHAKVKELEDLADALMIENVRLSEAESENRLLREELRFKEANPPYGIRGALVIGRQLKAEVIGRDPGNLSYHLLIDQGSQNGIGKGMPVVTARGLVGRISQTGTDWARVLLITDPASSINALVQKSRATGILQGRLGQSLVMRLIPWEEGISTGDLIMTSGLGGNFPKGLVIGQVSSVRQKDFQMYQEAEVKPTVDFNRLEMVTVITHFTPISYDEQGDMME